MPASPIDLAGLRQEYMQATLDVADVDADPLRQFEAWFGQALASGLPEPHAMTLATAGPDGRPSARMVLLKGFDARGFAFYTNFRSRKGRELDARPAAALLFFWPELERQVRIEGDVVRVADEEADAYFASRPRASRLGAWASPQSEAIADRGWLERAFDEEARRREADGDAVPRPPHWGGFRVRPSRLEFWQGRRSRLHDRVAYEREGDRWAIRRLAP